jgi:hypothetical protein
VSGVTWPGQGCLPFLALTKRQSEFQDSFENFLDGFELERLFLRANAVVSDQSL